MSTNRKTHQINNQCKTPNLKNRSQTISTIHTFANYGILSGRIIPPRTDIKTHKMHLDEIEGN